MLSEGTSAPPRRLRSAGAVFLGFLTVVVFSLGTDQVLHWMGVYPPWGERMSDGLFVLATAYRVVYTIAGCYVAARLAPNRPMAHALALGLVGLLVSVAGALMARGRGPELGPAWYSLAIVAMALPCAWLGGALHLRRAAGATRVEG